MWSHCWKMTVRTHSCDQCLYIDEYREYNKEIKWNANWKNVLFQKRAANWLPFVWVSSHGVALRLKEVGDLCSIPSTWYTYINTRAPVWVFHFLFSVICARLCACLCSVLPPHNGAHDSLRRAQEVTAGGVGSEKLPLSVASTQRKVGDEHVYARKQENSFYFPLTSPEINVVKVVSWVLKFRPLAVRIFCNILKLLEIRPPLVKHSYR